MGPDYDQEGVNTMNVRNCRMCGHIFNYVAGPFLCPRCREKMEEKFQDVSEHCDVEPSQIQQWLREERLELTEGSSIMLSCEKCGAPIRCGRFCEKCKYNMAMDLQSVLPKKQAEPKKSPRTSRDGERMRYL